MKLLQLSHLIVLLIAELQHIASANQKHNHINFTPPSPLLRASHAQTDNQTRRTSQEKHQPLRIKFHTQPLLNAIASADALTKARGNAIINQVLPEIQSIWGQSLSVIPSAALVFPPNVCFDLYDFPSEWSDPKQGVRDADLVIFVSALSVIGTTEVCSSNSALSTLAVSSPCAIDPETDRPVVGFANVCLNTLATGTNGQVDDASISTMVDAMSHELVHVLGLNSELYKYFRNSETGKPLTPRRKSFLGKDMGFEITENVPCVGGQPRRDLEVACDNTVKYGEEVVKFENDNVKRGFYEIVTPTVMQVARNHFNCQDLTGARLENQPTSDDCTGSHFDERTWFTEFMSAVYDEDAAYFSPLTLAFLEDTGWYKSDFRRAENSPFGLGAGCQFVNDDCIVDGQVPEYGKGFFCNDKDSSDWACGPSHRFRAKCDLKNYSYPKRTYFEASHLGPSFSHADYCPLVISDAQDCDDITGIKSFSIESFGNDSKCMDVTHQGTKSAVCLKASCNDLTKSYDFEVENRIYSCRSDFEVINVQQNGAAYQMNCPRLPQVCPK